ncbi:hypothetical protein CONLIGDRAFT_685558 [Coniochaeta ligniaria NRRL 30616]|uniref:Uncharacterized protein n=1 Tax=Coniochaeta ligniaria NRRL 30616 TaxID=1408157 RepID=A0A1J7J620_9PEZI|nr:hypothetical protein CONLIGDRAFT_685558 [Coniochaeta ligniaria NRRL 30616]
MSSTNGKPRSTIQFINVSHPEARNDTPKHRAIIRSHAARVTHAVARQARTIQYQAGKSATTQQQHARRIETDKPVLDRDPPPAIPSVTGNMSERGTEAESEYDVMSIPLVGVPGSERTGISTSFATPLTPIEHFLLVYYVTSVIPYLNTQCRSLKARGLKFVDCMAKEWVRLALRDASFLNGIFLNASRHLSAIHPQRDQQQLFADLAVRFKLACVRAVSAAISADAGTKSFSDSVVAVTIVMAFDEISLGDLAMSRRHVQGAVRMVELNGGPKTLGLNGFLEMVLQKYVGEVGLVGGVQSPPCGSAFGANGQH